MTGAVGQPAQWDNETDPQLQVIAVSHAYRRLPTLSGVSLRLAPGVIGCLMGPSGAGKTTLLNCIAGLEPISGGEILIKGEVMSGRGRLIAPEKRRLGIVFQDFALFPHLTVARNIGFGLARHRPRRDAVRRVGELLELCDLQNEQDRYPHELSGGQQQRAALARALAPRPDVLLLDEPFSSLDAMMRERLSRQVRDILKSQNATALLITHNQNEAFAIADEGGVINQGVVCQWDKIYNLYHRPTCAFVADFVGDGALVPGEMISPFAVRIELGAIESKTPIIAAPRAGAAVEVLLRPDDLIADDSGAHRATVEDKAFRGANILYTLRLASGRRVYSSWPSRLDFATGESVGISIRINHIVLFPAGGG